MNVRDYTMYVHGYIAAKDYTLGKADVKHLIEKYDDLELSKGLIPIMVDCHLLLNVTQAIKAAVVAEKEKAND